MLSPITVDYRKELEDLINHNGGDYRGNLTKDVTHLIAKEPSGAKYSFAAQWGIRTVSVEWLEQSLERGMILEESLYHLLLPISERGRNAWSRKSCSTTSLGKRARDDEIITQNARKLRRTASAKLSTHNDGLWSEINSVPVKAEEVRPDVWDEPRRESVDHSQSSNAADTKTSTVAIAAVDYLKRSQSESNLSSPLYKAPQQEGLFSGKNFLLCGFDERKVCERPFLQILDVLTSQTVILEKHLRSHGALIIDNASPLPPAPKDSYLANEYVVIPHSTAEPDLLQISEKGHQPALVTDMWIERCLYRKQFEEPQARITNTPFRRFPIVGFESLKVCSTGFQGIELVHMSKTVTLMGACYDEFFTNKASVLLCNAVTPGHEKLLHAQHWGVPAVKPEWLWDCVQKGESMPFGPYLVQPLRDPNHVSRSAETSPPQDVSAKARKSEKKSDKKSIKHSEHRLPPETENKCLARDTPSSTEHVQLIDPDPWSTTTEKPSGNNENEVPVTDTNHETPFTTHSSLDDQSSHTLRPTREPLHEISPNCSPTKQSASPEKKLEPPASAEQMPSPQKPEATSSSLGPTISSLLAHHQQRASSSTTKPSTSSSSEGPHPHPHHRRRQRRQLLGRAPSNLSSHSINLSRASSVDTMNTDGLGTPLDESSNVTTNNKKVDRLKSSNTTEDNGNGNDHNNDNNDNYIKANMKPMWSAHDDHDDDPDRDEPALPMTQLGYEDETVKAWRERVDVKMGVAFGGKTAAAAVVVSKGKGGTGTTTPGKGKGSSRGGVPAGGLGISSRTRLASGR